jgi:hypothetical protein
MLKGLLNGSLLLAGVGFMIIVITTPNASSEIMSRVSQNLEAHINSNETYNKEDGPKS